MKDQDGGIVARALLWQNVNVHRRVRTINIMDRVYTLRNAYETLAENWPFVLERYIRIEDKTTPAPEVSGRSDNLYDIVNIKDWDEYVKAKASEGLTGKISDWWGNQEITGTTTKIDEHTHTYEIDELGNGVTSVERDMQGNEHYHTITGGVLERVNDHRHEIETTGWRFGLRLSYKVEDASKGAFGGAFNEISQDTTLKHKSYKLMSPEGEKYIIPVASAELPIPDQEFTLFDPDSYDVYCLIQELIKTVEYRTWFRYMFPLTRYTSLMAIYISEGFFASLGNKGWPSSGGDMWPIAGGRRGKRFRKWKRADNDLYKNSRQDARDIFTTLYDTAASIDFESENKYNPDSYNPSFRQSIRPKVNFEDGLRWWQRGRRVTNRPFDKDGNECPDE